jgi:uncharacterized protein
MRRWIVVFCLLLILLMAAAQLWTPIPLQRPSAERWCFDFTQTLSSDLVQRIDKEAYGIRRNLDVDLVVVILPSLEGRDIRPFAAKLFTRWEIGNKGILILIAKQEQRIKIDVGPDLQAIYPDQDIGRAERELLGEFLEQADRGRDFLETLENFLQRLHQKKPGDGPLP